ncbi:DNA replication/repair protein RecF [Pacificimonas flava]|uniref:DNA replication and repair protein RecF n=1 Tax=Pacificimonas flava TaxID=1234595 RepID=M2TNX9_9SPHN|nr:DNA replication/repair protein RecF [Pacificimonas flava]EMD83446.1 DNA recombination and repair protein RecF [Pacificimonas flava]MBB5278993.1 DNA replication and repair protein RecF [Pacificimonas flava]
MVDAASEPNSAPAPRAVERLRLTDFRSYAAAEVAPGPGLIAISGPNGAGKTNLLEAVSLLAPGRGLRRANLSDMVRIDGSGGFGIATRLGIGAGEPIEIGTGIEPGSARRTVRVNGAGAAANSLSEWLSVLWLTPAMDRLFTGPAADRRRFLDRLTLALYPGHAQAATRYENAMRERNRLLQDGRRDDHWLGAVEREMGRHGSLLSGARTATIEALTAALARQTGPFPRAEVRLQGMPPLSEEEMTAAIGACRRDDFRAGRTLVGPHRDDLLVRHVEKAQPADRASTGEQKALLTGLVLAHSELVAAETGRLPILLLDEALAHLDEGRRAALFGLLQRLGGQVWMTGTDAALFRAISGPATYMEIKDGVPVVTSS